jgi:hypothetical protein
VFTCTDERLLSSANRTGRRCELDPALAALQDSGFVVLREPYPVERFGVFAPSRQARAAARPIVNAFQLAG